MTHRPPRRRDLPRNLQKVTPQSEKLDFGNVASEPPPLVHPSGAPLRPTPEGTTFRLPKGLTKAQTEQAKVFPETTLRSPEPAPEPTGVAHTTYTPRFLENVRLQQRPQFQLPRFEGGRPSERVTAAINNPDGPARRLRRHPARQADGL